MKIVLVRHFKVKRAFPQKFLLSKSEVIEWFNAYNQVDVDIKPVNLGDVDYTHCYSSPLKRARLTAENIYKGEIIELNALKELDILHLLPSGIRLPFLVWGLLVQFKYYSKAEEVLKFRSELDIFISDLIKKQNAEVLIVSHGFVMLYIQRQLLKNGFHGKKFRAPKNGEVYWFERSKLTSDQEISREN